MLINLLIMVALIAALEAGARLWFPRDLNVVFDNPAAFRRGRPYVQDDAQRGFVLRAGYSTPRMTVSRGGFRAHAPEHQEDVLRAERVLCVGGSTTFGWGLADHESYPAQLQGDLDGAWPERWSVVNAGVPSYTSEQVCLYLPELLELQPSLVVVQTLWNDLLFSFVENWFSDILVHQRPGTGRRFLLKHSAVFRAMSLKKPDTSSVVLSSPKAQMHYRKNLVRIVQACREAGAVVVFSMPPLQEAYVPETGMRIGAQTVPRPLFLETARQFGAMMQEVAEEHGVLVVRHRVAQDAAPPQELFLDAAHPRAEGYRMLAEDIVQAIVNLERTAAK